MAEPVVGLAAAGDTLSRFRLPVDAAKAREMALALGAEGWADVDPEDLAGRAVVPTFTACSGHWQDRRHLMTGPLGMDLTRTLHGEQRWRFERAPKVGEVLDGVTTLESMEQREGRRGGAMRVVTMRTRYTSGAELVVDEDMVLIETQPMTDTEPAPDDSRSGAGPSTSTPTSEAPRAGVHHETGPITRTDIVRYAGASGDFTRIHHDEPYAQGLGLPQVFTMGMLQGGMVGVHLSRVVSPESIASLRIRFRDRLWPGESLQLSCAPIETGVHQLEARAGDGRLIVTGTAEVRT